MTSNNDINNDNHDNSTLMEINNDLAGKNIKSETQSNQQYDILARCLLEGLHASFPTTNSNEEVLLMSDDNHSTTIIDNDDDNNYLLNELLKVKKEFEVASKNVLMKLRTKIHYHCRIQSPLLSMDDSLLGNVVSYLDEISLWNLEKSVGSMERILGTTAYKTSMMKQWEYLDLRQKKLGNGGYLCMKSKSDAQKRGIRFAQAAQYAKEIEAWGIVHYNMDPHQQNYARSLHRQPTKQELYTKLDFVFDYGPFIDYRCNHPKSEFFLRLSYQDSLIFGIPHVVVWEGIFPGKNPQSTTFCINEASSYICAPLDSKYFGKLREQLNITDETWEEDSFRQQILDRLTVTIINVPIDGNSHPTEMKLVATTSGYYSSLDEYDLVMFPSRSFSDINATEPPSVDDEASVNIGIVGGIGESNMSLLVEWGAYENV